MSADEYKYIEKIKRRNRDRLMALEHVSGVGIGRKIVDGKETELLAIRVYVRKKVPQELLDKGQLVPPEVEGVPTDVIETGDTSFLNEGNER